MILNKLVFPIKIGATFVEGAIPTGKLTGNNINKDMIYVISPVVGATAITATFQNSLQGERAEYMNMSLSSLKVSDLVRESESYYDLIKDWNVWQGFMPNKVLEYVAYNRAGTIGVSFNFRQAIVPHMVGQTYRGEIIKDDFVPTENGYYIVKTPLFIYGGKEFTFNDVLIKLDDEILIKKAIFTVENTSTLNYSVDPSVFESDFEGIDLSITESIVHQVNENTTDIKILFSNQDGIYYDIVELEKRVKQNEDDIALIQQKDIEQDAKINELETDTLENKNNINDINDELVRLDNVKIEQGALDGFVFQPTWDENNHILTLNMQGFPPLIIDLPSEYAFHNIRVEGDDLILTREDGTEVVVSLSGLLNGMASEEWVNANFVKTSDIVNNLTSTDTTKPLSANQGKVLNDTKENLSNKATNFGTVNDTRYPSVKAVKDQLDLTAKLAISNVFTQPQQVPNATLPQHTTNLSQVETMFEMFKQQLRGYNFAMPDLTGKEYLDNGVYRLHNTNGITLDYNIYNGIFIMNGVPTLTHPITINSLILDNSNYTYQVISLNEGRSNSNSYPYLTTIAGTSFILPSFNSSKTEIINQTSPVLIRYFVSINTEFNNYQFKLQLEKGTTATPCTVPGEIPQYKIVGEE